jgi:hypothetical protein
MPLQGGVSYTCAAGDLLFFERDGSGALSVLIFKKDGTPVVNVPTVLRGHIDGLTMSTAGSSTTMSIAAGQAADSTNAVLMSLAASIGKTTSAWAVGSGNGGLDTGTIANSTWYYFYLIRRPDTGVVDVVFSLNSTSPTLPTNYTQFRYIGAGLTNGSAQWVLFTQVGDDFYWGSPVLDLSAAASATAASVTLSVPRGRKMKPYLNANGGGGGSALYVSDLATTDVAPSTSAAPLASQTGYPTVTGAGTAGAVWTNTSAQIRVRSASPSGTQYIATLGWMDLRGRNA